VHRLAVKQARVLFQVGAVVFSVSTTVESEYESDMQSRSVLDSSSILVGIDPDMLQTIQGHFVVSVGSQQKGRNESQCSPICFSFESQESYRPLREI
jgi:hypothetical protein